MQVHTSVPVREIADFLRDRTTHVANLGDDYISGVSALFPGAHGTMSFAKNAASGPRLAAEGTLSSLVIMPNELRDHPLSTGTTVIFCAQPRREFTRAISRFFVQGLVPGISPSAIVAETAQVTPDTAIAPGVVVGEGVQIGAGCEVGANSVLLPGTKIGDHTIIGPNCTIGSAGFGYVREDDGTPIAIRHSGGVRIGNNVQIGANTCIDRGTLDDTVIEDFAMIDNLVHIAHNCLIETGAFVIATAILSGSVRIGPRAWIAPNVSIREGISVGADAIVGLAANVLADVPNGATVVGSPARELKR